MTLATHYILDTKSSTETLKKKKSLFQAVPEIPESYMIMQLFGLGVNY